MKIIITEHQFDEILTKPKPKFGEGMYHKVYSSKSNPNIVFKVGELDSVKESYQFFKNYPYLFPEVYGFKKLNDKKNNSGNDLYYLILEKLNTKMFVDFYNNLKIITINLIKEPLSFLVYDFVRHGDNWIKLLDYLEENNKNLFSEAHEFYILLSELNEIYDYPDLHDGQFGYDKSGTLKCLDF